MKASHTATTKISNIIGTTLIAGTALTATYLCAALLHAPGNASAAEVSASADIRLNVGSVIAINVSDAELALNITPTAAGVETKEDFSVGVSTNNLTGYSLTMNADTTSALTHTDGTHTIPAVTNSTPSVPNALGANTWGYNLGTAAATSTFLAAPTSPTLIKSASAPTSSDSTNITVGAKANTAVMAGTYSNSLIFTAVSNAVPEPTVVSVVPATEAGAGETLTITGTNFYGGGASSAVVGITIGGVSCTSFNVVSNTSATCVLPAHTVGTPQAVVVTTTMGVSNSDITVAYTVE